MNAVVRQLPADTPLTDAALFDRLHAMFGIGTFDETEGEWWQFRMQEISKIKQSRKKRSASLAELYVAALYCKAFGKDVRAVTWLYKHIGDAWRWWDARSAADQAEAFDSEYHDAIVQARTAGDDTWFDRLIRAQGDARQGVLDAWRTGRA